MGTDGTKPARRGTLRVYLGAAPGVGKTYAMLSEGKRRLDRGTDVVIAYVEDHDRLKTRAAAAELPIIDRIAVSYRGVIHSEMDTEAVIARAPKFALVDELAHSNVPGSRNAKRWQDVELLLEAGINVITTVNVQHLASLADAVEHITKVRQRETMPDDFVRSADQIELVDMTAEALRRRLAHGNVYASEKVDAALSNYFRIGNLTALRELALLWLADRVDDALQKYRADNAIDSSWPARERIVVALTGGPEGEALLRRGARIASRSSGAQLLAVHIRQSDGLVSQSPVSLEQQRTLVQSLGGTFHQVVGEDIAPAILVFAQGVNATQIVVGTSRRSRFWRALVPGTTTSVIGESGDIDVHVVTHGLQHSSRPVISTRRALSRARIVGGFLLAVVLPALLTIILTTAVTTDLTIELMLYMAAVVLVALIGGLWPSLLCAVSGSLLLNFYLVQPLHTLTIAQPQNAVALGMFVLVGAAVATVVDRAARARADAIGARGEADALAALSRTTLREGPDLQAQLEQIRQFFGQLAVELVVTENDHLTGKACAGVPSGTDPTEVAVDLSTRLRLYGPVLPAASQRILEAYAANIAAMIERDRLASQAASAEQQAGRNQIKVALLAAVSHDLRTPLASIKAASSTLTAHHDRLTAIDRNALLSDVGDAVDRLDGLVGNLLDMSRLQTGEVRPLLQTTDLDEVVPLGIAHLDGRSRVSIELSEDLPLVCVDAGLLERIVGNVVENALKYAPESIVRVSASALGDEVQVRVADHGPGVDDEAKVRIFQAFQRGGDAPSGLGVGLGLAVARGFAEAMHGRIDAEDTPGGGLTIVIILPVAL